MRPAVKPRTPAAFRLGGTSRIEFTDDDGGTPGPVLTPVPRKTGTRPWGGLFFTGLGGLVLFAIGLWAYDAVLSLFVRQDWLGWVATGLGGLATLGALGWLAREFLGLMRLRRLGNLRDRTTHAQASNTAALRLADELSGLYTNRPELEGAVAELARYRPQILDPADRIALTERLLMAPLDAQARQMVADTAKRVSVVTAISPAALIDLGFVVFSHLGLVRRLSELYGGRPGLFALTRLFRRIVTHLAITGGIALGDGLLQQILGHGLAARLSARLGEGVLNGILATRVGLAAIEVCRPMPFEALPRPRIAELAATFVSGKKENSCGESQ